MFLADVEIWVAFDEVPYRRWLNKIQTRRIGGQLLVHSNLVNEVWE